VKLEQDDVDRICRLAVDHDLDTGYIADRYDISRRRVQQLAKEYRDTGDLPRVETPGRNPFAEYPADIVDRVLDLYELHEQGAAAIAHILRQRDGLTIDNNRVHTILQEYEHVTENPVYGGQGNDRLSELRVTYKPSTDQKRLPVSVTTIVRFPAVVRTFLSWRSTLSWPSF